MGLEWLDGTGWHLRLKDSPSANVTELVTRIALFLVALRVSGKRELGQFTIEAA